jgi:parvulin-like peptidyl-prolyl isomerase
MAHLADARIDSQQIVAYLKHEMQLKKIQQQILGRQIVAQAAEDRNIQVTPAEIQEAADQFRYSNKLEDATQTYKWLNDQLITPEEWEEGIHERLLAKKLAEHLFSSQIETYFAQNKSRYEQAILYRISVPYQPLAQELFYEIEEEEISFFEAAHLYDSSEARRLACGFEGKLARWQVSPDMSAKLFGANPRELIGVISFESSHELWMVEEFIPPKLTDEIRGNILDSLFQEWLEAEINYLIHMGDG